MPNCIHVATPHYTVEAIFSMFPIRHKTIYEPGCGDAVVLQGAVMRGAGQVYGIDSDALLINKARERIGTASHIYLRSEDMLAFTPGHKIDLLYCYLMHGLTEKVVQHLIANDQRDFTVISHNYPMWMPNSVWDTQIFQPHRRIYNGLDKYPPYSLLYYYEVKNGVVY